MRSAVATVLILFLLLAIAIAFAWYVWNQLEGAQISQHGYYALALGASLTFLLGAGLMFLVFFSHRRGFDDEAGRD